MTAQVAHRVATVLACDSVAVLEAGCIVEAGSPADLLNMPGSALAAMQAADQGSQAAHPGPQGTSS